MHCCLETLFPDPVNFPYAHTHPPTPHTNKQSSRDTCLVLLNSPYTTHTPANNPVRGLIDAKGNCCGRGPDGNNCFFQSTITLRRARPLILYFLDLDMLSLPFCLSFLILNRGCKNIFSSFEAHELKYSM